MKSPWPLMENNIAQEDRDAVVRFLKRNPILTQSSEVRAFEREWSRWIGHKHSVFVNSGSSANFLSMAALRHRGGAGEIILAPFGWVSDLVAVVANGFTPVFVDINPRTLSADTDAVVSRLSARTAGVLLVHAQGFNGLTERLLAALKGRKIPLIEDACESYGATHRGRKIGSFGLVSNFSFYYAHHMSTIEGGMASTSDRELYEIMRMIRSHGLVRESTDRRLRERYLRQHPDLTPDFIFAYPGWNLRNNEIGAVIGRQQLRRLDTQNAKRRKNFELFLANLDKNKFRTGFDLAGSCNYAFNLVLQEPDERLLGRIMAALRKARVEFRRGSAGGGNQLRQPYARELFRDARPEQFPELEHLHFFGMYIGNYPGLTQRDILDLCSLVNSVR